MKLRPRRSKASETPVREVKLRMPLKKRKAKGGARVNRRSVKSDGLVKKNVEGESDQDPRPSNSGPSRRGCSRRQVSTVSRSSVSNIENGPGSGVAQLLEEILEHIYGFLTFADVKSARLVNKHWRQVSTTLLRRSSKMIKLDRSISDCITKMGDGQFPVNRLEVRLFDDYCHPELSKIYLACLPGICAWVKVKELTMIMKIDKLSAAPFVNYMTTLPTDCDYKDLNHFNLKLEQHTYLFAESWQAFTDFVRSILENSPNLREINVEYESLLVSDENLEICPEICPVIENLFPISNSVGTSKLSSINFESVPLEGIDLAKWSTLNLKPRKLGLNVSRFSKSNELLAKFLETQAPTLKELTLKPSGRNFEVPTIPFTFPRLEKLEELRVIAYYDDPVVIFEGIDYARMFPCLKKLDLKVDKRNWRDFLGNDIEPTNTVEELIFHLSLHNRVNLTPNPAFTAAKVFTGLKKLEISSHRDWIEAVYENIPNLEVLTLNNFSSETYDDGITGLGLEVCRRFRGVMTNEWIEKLQNAERRSMARLQNLKTLKLSCGVFIDRFRLSRLSLHVFKKMSSLRCLDLFDGCTKTAERCSADEDRKTFLEELGANFAIL